MRAFAAIAALMLIPLAAPAETLEFELPGVLGHYNESTYTRLDTLTYAGSQTLAITGMSVTWGGSAVTGLVECPDAWVGYDTLAWGLSIETYVRRSGSAAYWAGWDVIDQDGAFEISVAFQQAGFVTLNPGDVLVVEQYFLGWAVVDLCSVLPPHPSGDITAATLRLETEPALAVEQSTWGRIKSLYR